MCHENACATNIACLLLISVHCVKLEELEIHFNTMNIVGDLKDISQDPRFQELRSLPRCELTCLDVSRAPLTLDEPGFETVVNGMMDIFPALDSFAGDEEAWAQVNERIDELQET